MERILVGRRLHPTPSLLRRVWFAVTVARQRHRLSQLDEHLLRDIGIDRADAEHEAHRPLWDVPSHWMR